MWKFFEKLKKGLSKTHQGFVEKIDQLFLGKKTIDQDLLDELEGLLFEADLGVKTSGQLIEGVRQGLKRGELQEPEKVKEFIKQEILRILKSGEKPLSIDFSQTKPFVFMVVGVNGGGKDDHHRKDCPSIFIPGEKDPDRCSGYLQGGCGRTA